MCMSVAGEVPGGEVVAGVWLASDQGRACPDPRAASSRSSSPDDTTSLPLSSTSRHLNIPAVLSKNIASGPSQYDQSSSIIAAGSNGQLSDAPCHSLRGARSFHVAVFAPQVSPIATRQLSRCMHAEPRERVQFPPRRSLTARLSSDLRTFSLLQHPPAEAVYLRREKTALHVVFRNPPLPIELR